MAELIPNMFSSYELTEEEELQGSLLTITQKQVLQNKLSQIAEEKALLEIDVSAPSAFIQQEAYLKGQIEIIRWLLEVSNVSEEIIDSQTNQPQS